MSVNVRLTIEPSKVVTVSDQEYADLLALKLIYSTVDGGPIAYPSFTAAQTAELGRLYGGTVRHRLATYGDSMTSVDQGGYAPYGSLVAEYLGLDLFNPSQSGERTTNIALRQGGVTPRFTVPGGVIPAGTGSFPVTLMDTYTSGYNAGATPGNIGTFSNVSFLGVPVNLYFLNGVWTMARITAVNSATPVPAAGGYVRDIASRSWRNAINVYMGGYNGGDQVKDVASMRGYLSDPNRFIVLGMARGYTGGDPTNYGIEVARWKAAYPDQFFDMAEYVRINGLTDEAITPTAQDTSDIAAGFVPTSLRRAVNDPHYNAAGHRVIARRLAELLIERGFLPKSDSYRIPPRVVIVPMTLRMPSPGAGAYASSTTAMKAADTISVRLINATIPSLTSTDDYRTLAARWDQGGTSWRFLMDASGHLFFQDVNGNGYVANAPVLTLAGGKLSVRLDINRQAGTLDMFTSTDKGATWTRYGSPLTGRGTTYPLGGLESNLHVGYDGNKNTAMSALDSIQVLDGSGTTLQSQDFTNGLAPWGVLGDATFGPAA